MAQLADQGKPIPREQTISFEDPEDLARLVTTAKLVLLREVRGCPGVACGRRETAARPWPHEGSQGSRRAGVAGDLILALPCLGRGGVKFQFEFVEPGLRASGKIPP